MLAILTRFCIPGRDVRRDFNEDRTVDSKGALPSSPAIAAAAAAIAVCVFSLIFICVDWFW